MTLNLFSALMTRSIDRNSPFLSMTDGRVIRYGDIEALTARYANVMVLLGVKAGDRVAVQVEKSPEAVILYLACLRVGSVYLPLNPAYTATEISYFVADSAPRLFVCAPDQAANLEAGVRQSGVAAVETLDEFGGGSLSAKATHADDRFEDADVGLDALAAILYTSGTTGLSKGAMLTHGNLLSNASALVDLWRITDQDTLIHALPIFHTHGLFVALNTSLLAGASVLFLPKFDADAIADLLPRATTLMGVPTFYTRFLSSPRFDREALAHMRLFVSGSAPLTGQTHAAFLERTGHAILERYGMTETNMITSNPYDGDRRAGTVGMPLPDVELSIVDAVSGEEVAPGAIGVIVVKGPNVFKGYWRNPEKTAQEFRPDGFFITGDMGRVDEDGYVHIVGRSKDLIIGGGFNIYPAEVEAAIDRLAGVQESAVIGVPHPDLGECVTAVVVAKPGVALDEAAIKAELGQSLARYKIPRRLIVNETLPRNAMGKVQKNVLRSLYADLYSAPVKRVEKLPAAQ